jgi:hypothetical protein
LYGKQRRENVLSLGFVLLRREMLLRESTDGGGVASDRRHYRVSHGQLPFQEVALPDGADERADGSTRKVILRVQLTEFSSQFSEFRLGLLNSEL